MGNRKEDIIILGFGGHAKSVADSIAKDRKYNIVGYTDIHERKSQFRYLGTDDELENLFRHGIQNAVLGVGYMGESAIRYKLACEAKKIGFEFPVIIDPSANIANDTIIGEGTFIGKKTVINAESNIGDFCIVNTGSIIEHESTIGDFTHIAVGATLCGNVNIGNHCMIGANSTVIQGLYVGNCVTVGAGAVVLNNIENNKTVIGVPARVIK